MIHLTSHDITGIKLNSKNIENVYINSRHVWPDSSQPQPTLKNYLCFTGTSPFTFTNGQNNSFDYSYDQQTWTTVSGATITFPLSAQNNKIYLRGTNTKFASSTTVSSHFIITDYTYCSGNIMSIIAGDNFESALTISQDYCFLGLFNDCTGLMSLPELPATTLSQYCYRQMFGGCTSLTDISDFELPATTLQRACYSLMFQQCSGLVDASFTLPALTGDIQVYSAMFRGCTSLLHPPVIAMTDLGSGKRYQMNSMFENCQSLTYSPVLRPLTLYTSCYEAMFKNCYSLMQITALFTTTPSYSYMADWVLNVPQSALNPGDYYKNPNASYTDRGNSAIPYYWHINDYSGQQASQRPYVWTELEYEQEWVENIEYDEETGEEIDNGWYEVVPTGQYRIVAAWTDGDETDTQGITIISIDDYPDRYSNPTQYIFTVYEYIYTDGESDDPGLSPIKVTVYAQETGKTQQTYDIYVDREYESTYIPSDEPDPEEPDPEEEE